MTKPIRPEELTDLRMEIIPDWVFEIWNKMIAEKWNGSHSRIELREIKSHLSIAGQYCDHYVEIEDIYRKAGWKVMYVEPDFTENFPSYFEFGKA